MLIDPFDVERLLFFGGEAGALGVDHFEAEGAGAFGDFLADEAEADEAEGLAFHGRAEKFGGLFLAEAMGADEAVGFGDAPGEADDVRHGEVGGGFVDDVGNMADEDFALGGVVNVDGGGGDGHGGDALEVGVGVHDFGVDGDVTEVEDEIAVADAHDEFVAAGHAVFVEDVDVAERLDDVKGLFRDRLDDENLRTHALILLGARRVAAGGDGGQVTTSVGWALMLVKEMMQGSGPWLTQRCRAPRWTMQSPAARRTLSRSNCSSISPERMMPKSMDAVACHADGESGLVGGMETTRHSRPPGGGSRWMLVDDGGVRVVGGGKGGRKRVFAPENVDVVGAEGVVAGGGAVNCDVRVAVGVEAGDNTSAGQAGCGHVGSLRVVAVVEGSTVGRYAG